MADAQEEPTTPPARNPVAADNRTESSPFSESRQGNEPRHQARMASQR
jgi:hypothetical protein